jgi:holo-[acyl-carrier protein] synthase
MIVGIGTDIVEIERIATILSGASGEKFLERILTPAEQVLAAARGAQHEARRAQFVAGRFAAKEAVAKAFGCGIGDPLSFQHIEILHDSLGKPQCVVATTVYERLGLNVTDSRMHISISHTAGHATAFAVLETE